LKPYVAYRDAIEGYFSFQRHFVYFFQFFSRTWGFGWSVKGPSDTMSFQLGLPHFVLATLGVMSWRRNRQMQALYGIYLILMVLMTSVSEPLWTLLPGMDYIQFPWRILSVIATFQIICIAGVERLERRMSGWTVWPLIMVVSLLWYVQEFRPNPDGTHLVSVALDVHREQQHRNFFSYTGSDEFTPLSAQRLRALGPRGERGLLEGTLDRPVRESTGSTPYRITGVVPMGRRSEVIINQMYIPGWRVELNGSPVSVQTIEGNLASDGRMRLTVPSEETVIVAYYDGPPWWRLRTALNVLGIALILAVVIRDSRRGSSHAAPRLSEPATLI